MLSPLQLRVLWQLSGRQKITLLTWRSSSIAEIDKCKWYGLLNQQKLYGLSFRTHEHTDLVYQVSLIKRMVNTNMQEGQSATKFVDAWQALLDEVIISGLAIPETLQTMILLAALPSSWRAFITT
ncbi:hypothetical protein L7F22_000589 [Adiantum nelumboides]|nr:hypothetical protein [Adiantum nelumboides]